MKRLREKGLWGWECTQRGLGMEGQCGGEATSTSRRSLSYLEGQDSPGRGSRCKKAPGHVGS